MSGTCGPEQSENRGSVSLKTGHPRILSLGFPLPGRRACGGPSARTPQSRSYAAGWHSVRLLILVGAIFLLGFALGKSRAPQKRPQFLTQVPPLEDFLRWSSFSEVEQAKAIFLALGDRTMAEIRSQYLDRRSGSASDEARGEEDRVRRLDEAIATLEKRMEEFRGGDAEAVLRGEHLRLLLRADRKSDWLDAYLDLLYLDPAHGSVRANLDRAMIIARSIGREAEVLDAVQHWRRVPTRYWPHYLSVSRSSAHSVDGEPREESMP